MCGTCGCGNHHHGPLIVEVTEKDLKNDTLNIDQHHTHEHPHGHDHHHEHDHPHGHDHHHGHNHPHGNDHHHGHVHHHTHGKTVIELEKDILQKNQLLAERNRGYFSAKKMFTINLVSSPGSGKTSLLEKTLSAINRDIPCYVIEGDQQTTNDARRIKATGTSVVQVNTGQGCHLESDMVRTALDKLDPQEKSVLFIENVGNLVCPSMFDLGESMRVVIFSVTEGEDKPIKYPDAFNTSHICIINKIDLLPYVEFDLEKAKQYAKQVNPNLQFFEVSATKGNGMEEWCNWISSQLK